MDVGARPVVAETRANRLSGGKGSEHRHCRRGQSRSRTGLDRNPLKIQSSVLSAVPVHPPVSMIDEVLLRELASADQVNAVPKYLGAPGPIIPGCLTISGAAIHSEVSRITHIGPDGVQIRATVVIKLKYHARRSVWIARKKGPVARAGIIEPSCPRVVDRVGASDPKLIAVGLRSRCTRCFSPGGLVGRFCSHWSFLCFFRGVRNWRFVDPVPPYSVK